ncbi:hypothetical protein BJ973_001568 [Actinoplanes tereljensis]|nr:hypothetical protein [Actinoplanes tereljensis]
MVNSGKAPELLMLGTDAITAITSVLDTQRAEVETWRPVSAGTDFCG